MKIVFRTYKLSTVLCILGGLVSAVYGHNKEENSISETNKQISLNKLYELGSDYLDGYVFANILMQVDHEGNLYVFDRVFKEIRKYDQKGALVKNITLQSGRGPGEFMRPNWFALSNDNAKFYVSDMNLLRVSILDTNGAYIQSFQVQGYCSVFPGFNNTILVVYNQGWIQEPEIIHQFTERGNLLKKFCKRSPKLRYVRKRHLQGAYQVFCATNNSNLFVSYSYPYLIKIFDESYALIKEIREHSGYSEDVIQKGEFKFVAASSAGIAANDSIFINFVYNRKMEETIMHVYKLASGKEIAVFNLLNIDNIRKLSSVPILYGNNLFLAAQRPFLKIIKFKINLKHGG